MHIIEDFCGGTARQRVSLRHVIGALFDREKPNRNSKPKNRQQRQPTNHNGKNFLRSTMVMITASNGRPSSANPVQSHDQNRELIFATATTQNTNTSREEEYVRAQRAAGKFCRDWRLSVECLTTLIAFLLISRLGLLSRFSSRSRIGRKRNSGGDRKARGATSKC